VRYTARCPTQRDKAKHGTPGGGAMLLAAFSCRDRRRAGDRGVDLQDLRYLFPAYLVSR
jgi:hypothetical protein